MKINITYWQDQAKLFLRYLASGGIATAIDYFLYLILVSYFFVPVVSNVISYSISVLVNFTLQKKFVFEAKRKLSTTFLIAMAVSAGGLGLSSLMVHWLSGYTWWNEHQAILKLTVTGSIFFYNFFLKRFAFEKKFF